MEQGTWNGGHGGCGPMGWDMELRTLDGGYGGCGMGHMEWGKGGGGEWGIEDIGWETRGTWEMGNGMGATGWGHEMGNMGDMREWDKGHGVCGMGAMKWGPRRGDLKDVGWGASETWGT